MTRHALVWMVAALAACGDGGDDTGATLNTGNNAVNEANGANANEANTGAPDVFWEEVRDEVVMPTCALSSCHGAAAEAGLEFTSSSGPEVVVGVAATGKADAVLVVPGDAEGSYLFQKVTDAPGIADDPMPPPFGGLTNADIKLIRNWIDQGAL